MHIGIFLLLFIIVFVLVAIIIWVTKGSPVGIPMKNEAKGNLQERLLNDSDDVAQWLEDLARRQEESRTRRLH